MLGRKRTNEESLAFKGRILELKMQGRPAAEIAREFGVTRQYVSLVLAQAGVANGRARYGKVKPHGPSTEVIDIVSRLEQQGQSSLAEKLRVVLSRSEM
jgi:hypothetical protein